MKTAAFVIGVDYGTDSVRSVIVDCRNGEEVSSAVFAYPRWRDGLYCDASANRFRQHPLDYMEGLEQTIGSALAAAGPLVASRVAAISVDTTGSTPVAVDQAGTPLALLPGFKDNPDAMFVLWKDHSAVREAHQINMHASGFKTNYLQFVGGIYSSEWFWAKLLHILRRNKAVVAACHSFVEHCDWIPFLLTGGSDVSRMKRGVCSAGHKALWSEDFGGLPPNEFFASLDPLLDGFTKRLYTKTWLADQPAGRLSAAWATRLGLPANTIVGAGAFDAHMGAVGGQIEPYHLSKVMGTSTCDMLVAPMEDMDGKLIKGICGQVPGSIVPGMMGMEAGQSAFGDAYAWFQKILSWPLEQQIRRSKLRTADSGIDQIIDACKADMISMLSESAAELPLEPTGELSLDWFNGRRTPDANQLLKGAITGLNLGSDAPRIFRAIAEGTCFGAKAIVERFVGEGIPVKGLIGLGGVAKKSPYIMQMMADVLNMPIRVHRSTQTCAMGAAMFAATSAGLYPNVLEAMAAMGQGFDKGYFPRIQHREMYENRYRRYLGLGAFIEKENERSSP